jgi:hypothetical protein
MRNISIKHFNLKRTFSAFFSGYTVATGHYHSLLNNNIDEAATENTLVVALPDVQMWSTIISSFLGTSDIIFIRKPA